MFINYFLIINGSYLGFKALRVNALRFPSGFKLLKIGFTYICKSLESMKLQKGIK